MGLTREKSCKAKSTPTFFSMLTNLKRKGMLGPIFFVLLPNFLAYGETKLSNLSYVLKMDTIISGGDGLLITVFFFAVITKYKDSP